MLRVTKLTDYATLVLTVLAARPGDVLSAPELAEHAGLEAPTVAKLLKPLAQAGLVATRREGNAVFYRRALPHGELLGGTLHGALLDAELLADVYINLTRGQDALLMTDDSAGTSAGGVLVPAIDLRSLALQVLHASAQELAAHEHILVQIDKYSKGKTIWRNLGRAEKVVP